MLLTTWNDSKLLSSVDARVADLLLQQYINNNVWVWFLCYNSPGVDSLDDATDRRSFDPHLRLAHEGAFFVPLFSFSVSLHMLPPALLWLPA